VYLQGLERPFPYESVRDELLVEAPLARGTRAGRTTWNSSTTPSTFWIW